MYYIFQIYLSIFVFKILSNSKQITSDEFEKFRASREEVHRVGVNYSDLKKKTFKIIGVKA